jgi:hypothetical protein
VTQYDGRPSNSAKASGREAVSSELLSKTDRELVGWHLAAAAREVFPESEFIGKTAQQDFYFRELLERLLSNFEELQLPITGGNHAEVWALARSAAPKWRTQEQAKKRRSGYDRKSIKTLVHEWKRAVDSRPRSYSKRGLIEFALDTPDDNYDDVVLFATITDFRLVDGQLFSVDETELTSKTRLAAPSVDDSDSKAERERLLSRAASIVRDVERKYLEKLKDAPLEFVAAEVETLERDKRRHDYRRLAAAIVVVLGAAMAAYRILSIHRFIPVFDVSMGSHGEVSNVIDDHRGHLALAKDGKPVSQWANIIIDEGGNGVAPSPTKAGSVRVFAHDIGFHSEIPERWEREEPTVLPSEGTCFTAVKSPKSDGALVLCNILYDLRSIAPAMNADDVTLASDFGDPPRTFKMFKTDDVTCVNDNCSRTRLWMLHGYERDGVYQIGLVVFEDPDGWKNGTRFHGLPLVNITIKNGRLAAVESQNGGNFALADPPPDDLKLGARPKSSSTR